MKKYWLVFKNTISEYFIYRLNFLAWRLRVVFKILTLYFFWLAVAKNQRIIFSYEKKEILTYILGISLIGSFVAASRSVDIAGEINQGNLTNYLLKPISYFKFWFTKDLADKLLNIVFSLLEIGLILFFLKPEIFYQKTVIIYLIFFLFLPLCTLLYFYFNFLIGMIAFFTPEIWAARFVFTILLEFLAGGIFPLDILPEKIYRFLMFLPFPYFLFFPLKIYLGKASFWEIKNGFLILIFWLLLLNFIVKKIWQKGLRIYAAEGR